MIFPDFSFIFYHFLIFTISYILPGSFGYYSLYPLCSMSAQEKSELNKKGLS